jgi:hypothetical protein
VSERPGPRGQHRQPVPKRVRVTSPRTGAPRAAPPRSPETDIDEQTELGELYISSLVRSQLRLGLAVIAAFVVTVGGLPLLFLLAPGLASYDVLGVPVPWLLLGVLAYPAIALTAWVCVWAAERTERDFAELVRRR